VRAVAWHGTGDVRVDEVPDPEIEEPTDAIVRITSTAICGSDLHLLDVMGPYIDEGDILGHEPMGIVEEVGSEAAAHLSPGDRVVVPFNISCGNCWMCERQRFGQCETTQNHEFGTGASLFGYTKLYGQVPGGQAEYLRVPMAHFGPIKVPEGPPDERFLLLSDVLPTAWQAVEYADIPPGGSVTVFGLGPIGQMSSRIAAQRGARVIAVDLVPERLEMARRHGVEALDLDGHEDVAESIRELTGGRGTDSVIDAVGMEAHGNPAVGFTQRLVGMLPDRAAQAVMEHAGVDRLQALQQSVETVCRGGTISIIGVYGGTADPINMLQLFDKGVKLAMGQAHVKRWTNNLMPLVLDENDPLGVHDLCTHRLPLEEAPHGYEIFKNKEDGAVKVVLEP
jgi:threonine dehydrogenase-like Zn-dependent dehydrogenase